MGMLKDPKFVLTVAGIALALDMFGGPIVAKVRSTLGV
jgi:hypothetical protein